jgi:hypothetical protein
MVETMKKTINLFLLICMGFTFIVGCSSGSDEQQFEIIDPIRNEMSQREKAGEVPDIPDLANASGEPGTDNDDATTPSDATDDEDGTDEVEVTNDDGQVVAPVITDAQGRTKPPSKGNSPSKTKASKKNDSSRTSKTTTSRSNAPSKTTAPPQLKIDIDLTKYSITMAYATVVDLLTNPHNHLGKVVKIRGDYDPTFWDRTGKWYHYIIAEAPPGCCEQPMQFIWNGNRIFPDDFPKIGAKIEIVGVWGTYEERGMVFPFLAIDNIVVL